MNTVHDSRNNRVTMDGTHLVWRQYESLWPNLLNNVGLSAQSKLKHISPRYYSWKRPLIVNLTK